MISREEAIKNIKLNIATEKYFRGLKGLSTETSFIKACELAIEALSQPERPKGRWIDEGSYTVTARVCRCTNCNREITVDDFDDYCSNCGAEMVRGERE